jgi:hypothetical protein
MRDLDTLLSSDVAGLAADAAERPDFEQIERRGLQRRRTRIQLTSVVAVVVLALAGAGSTKVLLDREPTTFMRFDQSPSAEPSPSAWSGPLRRGSSSMPWVTHKVTEPGGNVSQVWNDGRDVAFGGIDIGELTAGGSRRLEWHLQLRALPPKSETLDPAHRVIEYGVVVDADGDRVADCEIGVNNDAPRRGDDRVWVKNLRTGVTDEQLGPPYGWAIDTASPTEENLRMMKFFFLGPTPAPCDRFGSSASFYAWSAVRDDGQVTAWDFAPDAAWLRMP